MLVDSAIPSRTYTDVRLKCHAQHRGTLCKAVAALTQRLGRRIIRKSELQCPEVGANRSDLLLLHTKACKSTASLSASGLIYVNRA